MPFHVDTICNAGNWDHPVDCILVAGKPVTLIRGEAPAPVSVTLLSLVSLVIFKPH